MRSEIHSLQVLRGIAAMMVVTNHFWGAVFGGIFKFNGGLGVDIFFVLSGFLMVYTQTEKRGPIKFFMGRVKRILPLYFIISLPLILMYINLQETYALISNIFLIPSFGDYHHKLANSPAWTLVYEMIFYVIFALSLVISKNNIKACALSVIIIISLFAMMTMYIGTSPRYGWIHAEYILGDTLMIDFAAGCILAVVSQKINFRKFIDFKIFMVIVILSMYLALDVISSNRFYQFGIPAIAIIACAIYSKEGKGAIYKSLHILGDASFSIYLSHIYFASVVKSAMYVNKSNELIMQFAVLLTTAVCVGVGIFINRTVEKPIISYFSRNKETFNNSISKA